MPTIEANGQTLYYEEHGDGEPLVCVMGLAADVLAWTLQVPAFSAQHRTIVFDNRDVGRSSLADGPYEIADMARDALALADALELETLPPARRTRWAAPSRRRWRLHAPERVRTLTLAVTFAVGRGLGAHRSATVWGSRVMKISHEEHIDELMLLNHSEEFYENADAVAFMRGMMLENPHPQPPEAFARQLDGVEPPRHSRPAPRRWRCRCT